MTTRDAFRRQGPFLGTGAFLQPRLPRPPRSAFDEPRLPPSDVLTSLWASAGPPPEHRAPTKADASDDPFARSRRLLAASLLGPRSHVPSPFWGAAYGLIWGQDPACRLLQLPTTYEHAPGLSIPRREEGHDLPPFLTCHAGPSQVPLSRRLFRVCEAVTRGEPHLRPFDPSPVLGSSRNEAGLPELDTESTVFAFSVAFAFAIAWLGRG